MKTQNVSSEDALKIKKSVIFFVVEIKKVSLKVVKKCAMVSERIFY